MKTAKLKSIVLSTVMTSLLLLQGCEKKGKPARGAMNSASMKQVDITTVSLSILRHWTVLIIV